MYSVNNYAVFVLYNFYCDFGGPNFQLPVLPNQFAGAKFARARFAETQFAVERFSGAQFATPTFSRGPIKHKKHICSCESTALVTYNPDVNYLDINGPLFF